MHSTTDLTFISVNAHTIVLLVDVALFLNPCTKSSVYICDICLLNCLRACHFDQTICEGMQVSGFRKLKQRQSRNRCPPETLLLFLVCISVLSSHEPDVSGAIVSAVPHVDVFVAQMQSSANMASCGSVLGLECHRLACRASSTPCFAPSFFMSGSHSVLISFVGPVRELPF